MTRTVRIRFFASAREAVGRASLTWDVPERGIAARALVQEIVTRYPALAAIARHSRLVHNGEYVRTPLEPVRPGDEFGIHPPYSGG